MTVEQETASLPAAAETSAPTEPQAKGLDAYIEQAIDQHTADEPAEAASAPVRDEKGRFVSKNPPAEEAAPAAEAAPAEPAEQTAEKPEEQQTPAPPVVEAPRNFSAEQKAAFATLPPEAQQMVAGIEKAREAEYTRRNQEVARIREVAEPFLRAVQPFQQYLSQLSQGYGVPAGDLVGHLLQAEYTLRTGSREAKAEALASIIADYGIDLSALTGNAQHAPDPVIHQLRQQVQSLQGELHQIKSFTETQHAERASSTIAEFASAKNDDGTPKYPYFDAVKVAMGHYLASGQANTMEEAYTIAAKPILDRIAASVQDNAKKADEQRKAAVDKARKVAHVAPTGSMPGGTTVGKKGLDAIIGDALAKHGLTG